MISGKDLTSVLYALATGYPDRALNVVQTCDDFDEELRASLWAALQESSNPSVQASRLGDTLLAAGASQFLVNECYRAAFYLGSAWIDLADNPLYAHFLANRSGAVLDKWIHYFPIYERHLARFRGKKIKVLEIGTYRGGGLHMLAHFLGKEAQIVGMDVDPIAVSAVGGRYVVELGDQEDPAALLAIEAKHGPFDVIIDDGGHTMRQQIVTTETLFPLLNDNGVLLVEDCHTSYWPEYGGGLRADGTFIEWAKDRTDDLHSRHDTDIDSSTIWATHLDGVHFYDSVVVFDREPRFRAFNEMSGSSSFMFGDRFSEGLGVELMGTREAVVRELELAKAENQKLQAGLPLVEPDAAVTDAQNEARLMRSELAKSRTQLAELSDRLTAQTGELDRMRNQLLESWEHTQADPKDVVLAGDRSAAVDQGRSPLMRDAWIRTRGHRPRVLDEIGDRVELESGRLPEVGETDRIVLLAQFSPRRQVSLSTRTLIRAFSAAGYHVVVISACEAADPLEFGGELPASVAVLRKPNIGYDFGSWAVGVDRVAAVRNASNVILANDSMVGPFRPIDAIIEKFETSSADVFGLTDTRQFGWHLQSYFLGFRDGVLNEAPMRKFWSDIRVEPSKDDIIIRNEIGFSKLLRSESFVAEAAFRCDEYVDPGMNPVIRGWRNLIDGGFPFVKREILTHPQIAPGGEKVPSYLRDRLDVDIARWL